MSDSSFFIPARKHSGLLIGVFAGVMGARLDMMRRNLSSWVNWLDELNPAVLWLTLNALAAALLCFVGFRYNYLHPDNIERLMFSTPDTKQYLMISEWLFEMSGPVPDAITVRPLLYPLLLGTVRQITLSAYIFWVVQTIMWLGAINLTAFSVYRFTHRRRLAAIAFGVLTINVSAIAITFFALTETTVIFLWSAWLWVFSGTDLEKPKLWEVFLLIFLLAMLTITKPVFQLHFFAALVLVLFKYIYSRKWVWAIALASLPILVQIIVNSQLTGMVGLSNISSYTLKRYLLPQVVAARSGESLQVARDAVKDYDPLRAVQYLLEDPAQLAMAFLRNVEQNLTSPSDYLSFYPKPYLFTQVTNVGYVILHMIMLPILLYVFWRKKDPRITAFRWLFLFYLLTVFSTGISFDEGDRLVLGGLPIWIALYVSVPIVFLESQQL